jgi:putative peptidoglycan lipid II flippase
MNSEHNNRNYIGRATLIIAVFSILSKILGLMRDALFSNRFGTSPVIDAYFAAFRIPDFVFNPLVLGTFSVAFIPVFSEYLIKDRKAADRLASSIINVTVIIMGSLSLIALIFINPLMTAIAPGFDGPQRELAKEFTRIFLLSPIFLTLSSVLSSMLNTMKRFTVVSLAPVIYNLSIIFGVVWLYPHLGNVGLALGVVLGAFLHFAVQIPAVWAVGFRYQMIIDYKDRIFIKFWKLYWPRIFSMGTSQITLLVATFFGSFLSAGSLAAFYYANNLQAVFLSVFAVSAALAVFPLMSDVFNAGDEKAFKDIIAKTAIQILYFMIPLSALMLIMRAQIVRLVLGIGQNTNFSFADTRLVSLTLGLFTVSLFAQGLIPLFTRAFYARQNVLVPVMISGITIAVNVVSTYYLTRMLGIPGMAMAFSITSIIELIMLSAELHHRIGAIHDEYLIINVLKILIASGFAGLASFLSLYAISPVVDMTTYWGVLIQAVGAGIVGAVVYIGASWLMGLNESHNLVKLLRSVLVKSAKPFSMIWNILNF